MSQKSNDCYFYYYSNCTKGDKCAFRHEPAARGTEEVCEEWEYGKCIKPICGKRHMVIQVNRSETQCYWENQPGGCQKPHCVFKHFRARKICNSEKIDSKKSEFNSNNGGVPSPKVQPVLINVDDTDEESPQKIKKRVPASSSTPFRESCLADPLTQVNNHSTKRKICEVLQPKDVKTNLPKNLAIQDVSNLSSPNPEPKLESVPKKTKTLRELKRDKILKARLEHERKLLALKKDKQDVLVEDVADNIVASSESAEIVSKPVVESKELAREIFSSNRNNNAKGALYTAPKDINEVKIKSFQEIMEEKKRRKGMTMSTVDNKTTADIPSKPIKSIIKFNESTNTNSNTKKQEPLQMPSILPRKMKIRTKRTLNMEENGASKPTKIKRTTTLNSTNDNGRPPNRVQESSERNSNGASRLNNTEHSEVNAQGLPKASDITNTLAIKSPDVDVEEELLNDLDNPGEDKSHDISLDDDDDIMNEMEKLLA